MSRGKCIIILFIILLVAVSLFLFMEYPFRQPVDSLDGDLAMNPKAVQPWFPKAPPLPVPAGKVVEVDSAEALYLAVAQAEPGITILLADGTYYLIEILWLNKDRLTLRSQSGSRDKVILDGSRNKDGEPRQRLDHPDIGADEFDN